MSALPYMPLYIADYMADAGHLPTIGHGAYMLLLLNYWQRQKPLPADDFYLQGITKLSDSDWERLRPHLAKFFQERDGHWHHKLDSMNAKRGRCYKHSAARPAWAKWVSLRNYVFERDGFACTYCESTDDLECDHIMPVSRGGSSDLENLTTSCRLCNRAKGAMTPEEWVR